jgi:hypothetical protein
MSNTILFIFEGNSTEKQIADNLTKYYVNENTNIQCAFCADIYQLYSKICADDDLDTFTILKNRNQNKAILSKYKRSDFAEIYMFFDYDGHAPNSDDDAIKDLLAFFNEETDTGKLYISYPMVEAIKHISPAIDFKTLKVKAKVNIRYKNLVGNSCRENLKNFNAYSENTWKELLDKHLKKMNYIVTNKFSIPNVYIPQVDIFQKQLEKYINVDQTVAVLSPFPVFVFDYYGYEKIFKILNK